MEHGGLPKGVVLGDLAWIDISKLQKNPRTRRLSDQLYRAIGSIGANIAEGFSYTSKKEQARYYEYSLGEEVVSHRMRLIAHIIRQML